MRGLKILMSFCVTIKRKIKHMFCDRIFKNMNNQKNIINSALTLQFTHANRELKKQL